MNKEEIVAFFDRCAPDWDAEMIRSDEIIGTIFDNAGICAGVDVLDVACGTGVLFPDYLARDVHSVTGIDISPKMAEIAASKYPPERVRVVCGDVETAEFGRLFDAVMVYNAFPHFPDPAKLVRVLSSHVKPGGRLSVAHGMSRQMIDRHHSDSAAAVSLGLMGERELAALFTPYFDVDVVVSNERMYQVCGIKIR